MGPQVPLGSSAPLAKRSPSGLTHTEPTEIQQSRAQGGSWASPLEQGFLVTCTDMPTVAESLDVGGDNSGGQAQRLPWSKATPWLGPEFGPWLPPQRQPLH